MPAEPGNLDRRPLQSLLKALQLVLKLKYIYSCYHHLLVTIIAEKQCFFLSDELL